MESIKAQIPVTIRLPKTLDGETVELKHRVIYASAKTEPVLGANKECMILDDNTFRKPNFWQRLKTILKNKWKESHEEIFVAAFLVLLVTLVVSMVVFPMIAVWLACGTTLGWLIYMIFLICKPIVRFLKFWIWDTLKEAFKNE